MTSNAQRKAKRRAESFALVHQTPADLGFRAKVERELTVMATTCREKRLTYRTPEFRADARRALEEAIDWYEDRQPVMSEPTGSEFEWGQPIIRVQDDRYVMVAWKDQGQDEPAWPGVPWRSS